MYTTRMELDLEKPRRGRVFGKVTAILLLFLVGLFVGRYLLPVGEFARRPLQFVAVEDGQRQLVFPTFWEAWDLLHDDFINDIDDTRLFYGAVEGMVAAAGDPYTVFSDPQETKQFEENIEGSFSGVGIEIGKRDSAVTVIAPLTGSPADQAGILAGDIIVAVDDQPIAAEDTIDDVVSRIRGVRGTQITLTVIHEGESDSEAIVITRDTIHIESVQMTIGEDGIAHIAISSFNGDTAARMSGAASEALRDGVSGVILDLRNNPGGFLESAVEISSIFLEPGTLVVSEKGDQDKEYLAKNRPVLEDVPVVVLVNGGSASASEIVAGALQDQRQAPIVGQQTFGKGSVQEFKKLSDGSSIRVTVAKWFTPSGRSIDDEGITPDIAAEDNRDTEEDEALNRAREEL